MNNKTNAVFDSIISRRSVRAYMRKQVPLEVVLDIVKAGQYAPNGMHQEPWHFTVIRNAVKLEEFGNRIAGDGCSFFYHAPTLVVVSVEKGNGFALQDAGCAMTNMMQAAHALGVSSVWCNRVCGFQGDLKDYGIPEGYVPTASLALGYSAVSHESPWKVRENTVTVVE